MGHGREVFKFSIFVITPVLVSIATSYPPARKHLVEYFPYQVWTAQTFSHTDEDRLSQIVEERKRWREAVVKQAKS